MRAHRCFVGTAVAALVVSLVACSAELAAPPAPHAGGSSQAIAALPRVDRVAYAADDLPYFVRGVLGRATSPVGSVADADAALNEALEAIAPVFELEAADLRVRRISHDELGMTHVTYDQVEAGLRVVGGELTLHLAADGQVVSVTSSARGGAPDPVPSISAGAAAEIARQSTAGGNVDVGAPQLAYVIATADGRMHLAWEVTAIGRDVLLYDDVYVDAHTGLVADRRPQVFTARDRQIFDGEGKAFPIFFPAPPQVGSEGSPPVGDEIALAAYDNTGATYDCYADLFGRDSYDDAGAALKSLVHVVFPLPSGGTTGNNAAWALGQMVYGDGDGDFMGPTANSLDVTAHELTHGVTSATAGLAYQNESGALNEAMSDVIAAVCEAYVDGSVSAETWLVGEDIMTPAEPGDALRYMDDPTKDADLYPPELGGSRDFYADRYTGSEDNGGVHLNSGIGNLAFKLLVTGGTHPQGKTSFAVPGIGIEPAGAIFYRALTAGYMNSNTNFAQARTATEEAAADLYSGGEVAAVGAAWAAVGVGEPPDVDLTPPTVTIVSPADGAEVAAGFEVTVEADDDVAVTRVELHMDGALVDTLTSPPYVFTTDAAAAAGAHELEATAYDDINRATDSITVTIADDAPPLPECTIDQDCADGERCDDGTCVPEGGGNPGDPDDPGASGSDTGCGCAATGASGQGALGTLLLLLGVACVLRRPRRRR